VSVTDIDAERVFRCAYRIEQVAEDVRTAAARTARCFPDDWWGDAGIAYQQRLDQTADRVRRMSVAYDAAGAALAPYAQAVLEALDMWRRSESLLAEAAAAEQRAAAAASAQGAARLAGPGPEEGFRAAAYRLQAEAADVEHRAAVVCAAMLEDEAGRAPETSAWRSADRFLGDVARFGVETVAGTASLAGLAWHALPGVGGRQSRSESRHGLVDAGKGAVVSIWKLPMDIDHDLADDRPGLALSAMAGVVGPGKLSKLDRHRVRDAVLAEKEAFREADRRARLASHQAYKQSAAAMVRDGVSLLNQEKRGGHTLREHVGVSRRAMAARIRRGWDAVSTFPDEASAERAVNTVLREHADELASLYADPGGRLRLVSDVPDCLGRLLMRGSKRTIAATRVMVVVDMKEGEPRVLTAFPIQ
jgi:uncharacterized protein YukE